VSQKRLAILYFGAMGQRWTELLKPRGIQVTTTVEGRGKATADAAKRLGAEILPTVDDVVRESDIVVSLVAPEAAEEVGMKVANAIKRTGSHPIFVECNATAPDRTTRIGKAIMEAGGRYVDGCVVGPASRLGHDWSVCYLSGEPAPEFAALIGDAFPVHVFDDGIATVSSFKMTYAAFNRGLGSLLIEAFIMAERYGALDNVLTYMYKRFPDIMKQMDYYLPGMPAQAVRRVGEMLDVAGTMEARGMEPSMIPQAVKILRAIAQADLKEVDAKASPREQVAQVIRIMSEADILSPKNLAAVKDEAPPVFEH
jgi:3-hydroxyisobutyrate dehydrogenase-like beta-hydroxyacid dehydrogenase